MRSTINKLKKWSKSQKGGNNKETKIDKLLVKTSDNKTVYISNKILKESGLIKDILEDIPISKLNEDFIPLDRVSQTEINIIDKGLDTSKLNLEELKALINAANYLQMDIYMEDIAGQIAEIIKQRLK